MNRHTAWVACILVSFFMASGMLQPKPGEAHKVNVYAWPENGRVHVETRFSGGNPAIDTPLEVYTHPGDDLLMEARTNDQGVFEFPLPDALKKADDAGLKIVLLAGMGHRDEWIVTPQDLASLKSGASQGDSSLPVPSEPTTAFDGKQSPPPSSVDPVSLDVQVVERIVNQALDRKLAPLLTRIEASQDRISVRDVLAGLGYIVGIAGLIAAFRKRRTEQ